tara:strand:+ start:14588 stop:14902 length:315 start_codon:yes stop_codon:yes gene_type:complete
MDMSDEQIQNLIKSHREKLRKKKEHYHAVLKHDPEFIKQNRERAKKHFDKNREQKKEYYMQNLDKKRLNNYYYNYKKQNRLDDLKKKHPEIYQKLIDTGKIQEE